MSKWLAIYGGKDLDIREVLNEASMSAHALKDWLRAEAISQIDWGTSEGAILAIQAKKRLEKEVIGPIERLRVAVHEDTSEEPGEGGVHPSSEQRDPVRDELPQDTTS